MRTQDVRNLRLGASVMALALILAACGPSELPTAARSEGPNVSTAAAPKSLTVALQEEPISVVLYGARGEGGTTSAEFERWFIFHTGLTLFDRQRNVVAHAAQKVPTVEDGDWKVNPNGTMEVTWKIRPDVYWHDGTPLTAQDFVFGFEVIRDPKLGVSTLGELLNIESVRVADDKTLVVSWKTISISGNANSVEGIPSIARHQVEPIYRTGDIPAFEASEAWRAQYIGLGPYRVTSWQLGSVLEAEAFDRYFLGRPKIDRLSFRWVADINVLTAQVLAGTVDLVPPGTTIKPEQMAEIRRQWGPNRGTVMSSPNDVRAMALNFREERPWNQDVRFRQAMLHSINRDQLVEVLQSGFTEIAHYFAFPEEPVYRMAEQRGVPKYPYDPSRAQQLFTQAGWSKGGDGLLRKGTSDPVTFYCCRYADADSNDIRESLGWGTDLKAAGLEVIHPIPAAPAGISSTERRRVQALGPWGGSIGNFRVTAEQNFGTFIEANVPRQETRWSGINSGFWTNAAYEGLFDRAQSTLNATQRHEVEFQLMQILMNELPRFPVYYNPLGLVVREGVQGIEKGVVMNRGVTWNMHTWDIK